MAENQSLLFLYQENAKVAAIFWEWRHKALTAFFAAVVALFTLAGWFYLQIALRPFVFAPLALGAVFCLAALALDLRNAVILRECYRIGKEIEEELCREGAIFKSIGTTHYTKVTYTIILRLVYAGVGLFLAGFSYRAYDQFR
jgi:hypothetical protein